MSRIETRPSPAPGAGTTTASAPRAADPRADALVVAGSALAALLSWTVWTQALGVHLAADTGGGVRQVAAADVAVAAVLASTLGLLLCRLLVGRAESPATALRRWTVTAVGVCVVSLLGTAGAVTATAGVALASLHLVVGATVVLGARWARRAR